MNLLWSQKLWDKIKQQGIAEEILDVADRLRGRSDVIYRTDWTKDYQESVVKYLKRQLKLPVVLSLVASQSHRYEFMTPDDIVLFWQQWIVRNITYTPDQKKFGTVEKWEDIDNVLLTRQADCESMHTLLYVLCRASGIPRNRLRLWAGDVRVTSGGSGHCYLEYRSLEDGHWRIMDTCYWVNKLPVFERDYAEDEFNYIERWWGFDELRCYKGD